MFARHATFVPSTLTVAPVYPTLKKPPKQTKSTPSLRNPDFGAHRVLWVAESELNGTPKDHDGMSKTSASNLVQGVLNGARGMARTVRRGNWGAKKDNAKRQVHVEFRVDTHFVKAKLWGPLLQQVATGTSHGCAGSGGRHVVPCPMCGRVPGECFALESSHV